MTISSRLVRTTAPPSLAWWRRELAAEQLEHKPSEPPAAVQYLLNELYQCPDCVSEVRWDLKVAVGHDPMCITRRS
jgi:hypothetical protein